MFRPMLAVVVGGALTAFAFGQTAEIQRLLEDLHSKNEQKQLAALKIYADRGPSENPPVAIFIGLLKSPSEDVRLHAALVLGKAGKAAVPALVAALPDKDEDVRYYAVWALGLIGKDAQSAAPAIIKALSDPKEA